MKVEFYASEIGDVVFTKESNELDNVINVISREGTEINLIFSENDFVHGYVEKVVYDVNAVDNEESLRIYISKILKNNHREKISSERLESVKLK